MAIEYLGEVGEIDGHEEHRVAPPLHQRGHEVHGEAESTQGLPAGVTHHQVRQI